jgi:hypothetical protein
MVPHCVQTGSGVHLDSCRMGTGDSSGRNSVVGIATVYGLDGSCFEPQWVRDLPHKPQGPPNLLCSGYRGGQGVALTILPHLIPKLKKGYSYSSTPSSPPPRLHGLLSGKLNPFFTGDSILRKVVRACSWRLTHLVQKLKMGGAIILSAICRYGKQKDKFTVILPTVNTC